MPLVEIWDLPICFWLPHLWHISYPAVLHDRCPVKCPAPASMPLCSHAHSLESSAFNSLPSNHCLPLLKTPCTPTLGPIRFLREPFVYLMLNPYHVIWKDPFVYVFLLKFDLEGLSLVVQRLRLFTSIAGSTRSIPGWRAKIPHAAKCG